MKKKIILLFPVMFLLFGVGIFLFVKAGNKKGIYYDELNPYVKYTYNPLVSYGYSTLLYNGKVYTGGYSVSCSAKEFKNLQRKELSAVYGNHGIYWSADSSDLYETTEEGIICRLEGYQPDSRVCVRCEAYSGGIGIFDCLNDLYLFQGKDLYQDIFHLENAKEVYAKISEDMVALVESDDEIFSDFFSALCEGEFIPQENISESEYDTESDSRFLFQDALGIQTEIKVYPNGYVRYVSPENTEFVIKLDKQLCDKVYTKYFIPFMEQTGD